MGRLIYAVITSLDGYVADEDGSFDWGVPDDEVHAAINDLERSIGTFLFGRRLYEVMAAWETIPADEDATPQIREYAGIWHGADKVVFSRTLNTVSTARTRIEWHFEPDAVRRMVDSASADVSIGGPELAAHALRSGLVHEMVMFVFP